jgi:hypothetical protein
MGEGNESRFNEFASQIGAKSFNQLFLPFPHPCGCNKVGKRRKGPGDRGLRALDPGIDSMERDFLETFQIRIIPSFVNPPGTITIALSI